MSAMTVAEIRRLRHRIVAPNLTPDQRAFRAMEYLDAAAKTPLLVFLTAWVRDALSPRWTRDDHLVWARAIADVVREREGR